MKALIPLLVLAAFMSSLGSGCTKSQDEAVADSTDTTNPPAGIPTLAKLYKDSLVGTWIWSNRFTHTKSGWFDTSYMLPDTTFSIIQPDDTTLLVFGNELYYTEGKYGQGELPPDTSKEIVFWNSSYEWPFWVRLNRTNDSVLFNYGLKSGVKNMAIYEYRTQIHH